MISSPFNSHTSAVDFYRDEQDAFLLYFDEFRLSIVMAHQPTESKTIRRIGTIIERPLTRMDEYHYVPKISYQQQGDRFG